MRPSLILSSSLGKNDNNCNPHKEGDNGGKEKESSEESHEAEEGREEGPQEDCKEEVTQHLLHDGKALVFHQGLFLCGTFFGHILIVERARPMIIAGRNLTVRLTQRTQRWRRRVFFSDEMLSDQRGREAS